MNKHFQKAFDAMAAAIPLMIYTSETDNRGTRKTGERKQWLPIFSKHRPRPQKEGSPAFSPGIIRDGQNRASANVELVSALVADIDDGVMLDELQPSIKQFSWLAYSSFSHDPEHGKHKFRLVFFPSRTCTSEEWREVWTGLNALLGGHCDPACKDPARLYYLPSCPVEMLGHAFATDNEGDLIDPDDLKRPVPPAGAMDVTDALAVMLPKLPPPPETPEEIDLVKSKLSSISADCCRTEWLAIVWSVASLGWVCSETLARDWSRTGAKWDETEFAKVWSSFKPDGGISVGTLHHYAVESGWVDSKQADKEMEGDLLNARMFAKLMQTQFLFNHTRHQWHQYDRTHWRQCEKGEEVQAARHVVGKVIELAAKRITTLATGDLKRGDWNRHLRRSQQLSAIEAMLKLAQSESGIAVKKDELDSDPWLLGCMNGAIDLRTGTLLAHDPAMKITRIALASYDRAATCPHWEKFLSEIFADDSETIAAIKRMVGYSLLGTLLEEVFFFAYGSGANGKSVFFNVLVALLADYALTVPAATLMVKRDGEGATNDIARMAGARFAVANETKTGDKLDDQKLKQLASRDRVAARYLYGEYFEFEPSATVWVRGNHKPIVTDDSDGLWRRLVLIPFTRTIPEEQRDPHLTAKLLQEADGILTWGVDGCLEYQRDGLKPSAAMRRASAEYRKEADILGEWLETCCEIAPEEKVEQGTAYQSYRTFCGLNGVHPTSKKLFSRKLDERKLPGNAYVGKSRAYAGFKLRRGAYDQGNR